MFKLLKKLRKRNKYLYRSGWGGGAEIQESPVAYKKASSLDTRIEKKPVEVYNEITSKETPKINLINLDGQIRLVRRRLHFLEDELGMHPSDEFQVLEFLKARKKYLKYKNLFGWHTTTHQLIDDLCKKYKLQMVGFPGYYKNVPMEAVDELEKYLKAYKKISKTKPVINLIIDDGGKETRKDPIVLASSPFGFWFYVLGAWDKEVEIIDELFYRK